MSVDSADVHVVNAVAAAVNNVYAVAAAVAVAVPDLVLHVQKSVASADVVPTSVCETLGNGVMLRLGCR